MVTQIIDAIDVKYTYIFHLLMISDYGFGFRGGVEGWGFYGPINSPTN